MTFEDEFITLLEKHGVQYDPRHVFDWCRTYGAQSQLQRFPRPYGLGYRCDAPAALREFSKRVSQPLQARCWSTGNRTMESLSPKKFLAPQARAKGSPARYAPRLGSFALRAGAIMRMKFDKTGRVATFAQEPARDGTPGSNGKGFLTMFRLSPSF